MAPLKKAAALVARVVSVTGLELHPKVAANVVGAGVAGLIVAGLALANVHVAAPDEATIAVICTIVAGFLHPDNAGS